MVDTFNDLDWRDKPKASPTTGGLVQSRVGKIGDFHVVVPWPGGGLVHYSRDNFKQPELPWSSGTLFGDAHYIGAAVAESDYTSHEPTTVKNLEVLAVTTEGRVEQWSRECGGAFRWSMIAQMAAVEGAGPPSLSYTGSCFKAGLIDWFSRSSHGIGTLLMAWPSKFGMVEFWRCVNLDQTRQWDQVRTFYRLKDMAAVELSAFDTRQCVGVSAAMHAEREDAATRPSWKELNSHSSSVIPTAIAFATTFADGGISVFQAGMGRYGPVTDLTWANDMTIYAVVPLNRPLGGTVFDPAPARGSPCMFQSDFRLKENAFGGALVRQPQVGDLVVMAPARDGGILFWLKNFGDFNDPTEFDEGWNFQHVIGTELYDTVSCIQSNFAGDNGNLEITARRTDQKGFDQYWADWSGQWGGPIRVLGEVIGTVQQALTAPAASPPRAPGASPAPASAPPADRFDALKAINVDYSVAEKDLRDWLSNPTFTPYPALADALVKIIWPGTLQKPVQIDVIRDDYESRPGITSPRTLADVNLDALRASVLAASNDRYTESAAAFDGLVRRT